MPVVLPNVTFNTLRSAFNPGTLVTPAPAPFLTAVSGHAGSARAAQLAALPDNAADVKYVIEVDTGTDVISDDIIVNILLNDGVTAWPNVAHANTTWIVRDAQEGDPGILAQRYLFIAAVRVGGPES